MIVIDDVSKCCGCEACVQRCPRGCIEMKADHEGFFIHLLILYNALDVELVIEYVPYRMDKVKSVI